MSTGRDALPGAAAQNRRRFSMSDTPTFLYGMRCADASHPEQGTVYGSCLSREQAASLAESVPCYELVVSTDGGQTWARAEQ